MYGRDFAYDHRYVDHGYPFWEWLVPLLLFGLLIGVAIWAVWRLTSRTAAATPGAVAAVPVSDPAVEELRMRYVRGEVSSEEFAAIATGLGAAPAAAPSPGSAWPVAGEGPDGRGAAP